MKSKSNGRICSHSKTFMRCGVEENHEVDVGNLYPPAHLAHKTKAVPAIHGLQLKAKYL